MELSIEQALQRGIAAHREGNLKEAERLYRAILNSQPSHPDANHNLGVLAIAVNKAEAALPLFKIALEANPKIEQFWLSYIDALIKNNQTNDAKQVIKKARKRGFDTKKLQTLLSQLRGITDSESPPQEQINNLLMHYQKGQLADARKLAVSMTKQFPRDPFGWKVLGAILGQTGKKSEAVTATKTAVALSPEDAEAHCNLGLILNEMGRLDEAKLSYTKAIKLNPSLAEAHSNLGTTLRNLGRLGEAEKCCRQALKLQPNYAEAHNNLGVTLKELGRLGEAEISYTKAIKFKPHYAEALNNLGVTLKELNRLEEAEALYRQAIALKQNFPEVHSNLGVVLKEQGKADEAEASYKQAITLKSDFTEAYLNLFELLENINRTDEVLLIIRNTAKKAMSQKADFLYYHALIEFRNENHEKAEKLITTINENELQDKRKASLMKLQADLYQYRKNYKAAFEKFKSMNEYVKHGEEYQKHGSENYFNYHREKLSQIKRLQQHTLYKPIIKPTWIQPTFLIGFPRSGTTLLDTILRTHSKIDILEELPMVEKMRKSLGEVPTISMIEEIDNASAKIALKFYLEELRKHIEVDKNRILIDKLPLNILHLPLINQVFPDARFILALRHPLDCITSCWMQNFKLNPAMANMVDLEKIIDFYCIAMGILKKSIERYSLNVHRIRYEDLVLDFEGNVSKLLTFLNLKWEESLRYYQKTALARGQINTPSYSQVIKPIYKTASYRWKNYEKYLPPFKEKLEPWLKEFGY